MKLIRKNLIVTTKLSSVVCFNDANVPYNYGKSLKKLVNKYTH